MAKKCEKMKTRGNNGEQHERKGMQMAKFSRSLSSMNAEWCLGANRSRGDVFSCAFVVLTLTAAETQLTKGFSLSSAATPRHSAVASGKAAPRIFRAHPRARRRGRCRASMLATTTAITASAVTSSTRTGGEFAAPAVLQKLGHLHNPSPRVTTIDGMIWFTRIHARPFGFSLSCVFSIYHLSIDLSYILVCLSVRFYSLHLSHTYFARREAAFSMRSTFTIPFGRSRSNCQLRLQLTFSLLPVSSVTENR